MLNMNVHQNKQEIFAYKCLHHPKYKSELHYETYKMAELIICAGTMIGHFGIVVNGVLKAERYTSRGCELCSAYFEDNDAFPEFLYFTGSKVYTYSLVAVKKTTVAWIPVSVFEHMLEESDMMYAFMLYMSKRGLKNQLLLNCLTYQLIRERVAYWITGMHNISQNNTIPLPRSQTIWANTLHVSRSSLNQELKTMEKEGIFRIVGHVLVILDMNKLNHIL